MLKHLLKTLGRKTTIILLVLALLLPGPVAFSQQPSETPEFTNRLIDKKSPYLLQHAHNPVDWYPWGDEVFACTFFL